MQAPAYNRTTDFASRDGDETDHAALNAELDSAAESINALRSNQALIQADDGGLKAGIVTADALAPDAFDAVLGAVADSVEAAQNASQSALTSAVTAGNSATVAQGAKEAAQTSQVAAGLAAQAAAQAAQDCADALAVSLLEPDQLVYKDGSVAMTAGLPLAGDAAQPLHAVPLQQAQALASAAQAAATGAATAAAAASAAGLYLRKDGGTSMTAELPLAGNAATPLGAVPKQQAESIADAAEAAANSYTDAAQTATEAKLLGLSQTWQAVTRAGGTTYFNTTGRPIQLLLSGATSGANVVGIFLVAINGGANLPIATAGGSGIPQTTLSGTITIPAGASYVVTYNNVAGGPSAYELR